MTDTSRPGVYAAICKVQGLIAKTGISKDQKNIQQGYKFRGIDDIYNALAVHLANCDLCILPNVLERTVTERSAKGGGVLFCVIIKAQFDFVCGTDGSRHAVVTFGEAMDSGDKATNKAMSAAYKYACLQTFCIPTEGENDADARTHEVAAIERITAQQVADLDALIDEVGANKAQFMRYLKVSSLDQIVAAAYPDAVAALERKRTAK